MKKLKGSSENGNAFNKCARGFRRKEKELSSYVYIAGARSDVIHHIVEDVLSIYVAVLSGLKSLRL